LGSDGIFTSLTNGSQNWGTALTVLATIETVSKERLCQTIDILLAMQNSDSGFGSYERIRECTSIILNALHAFQKRYPDYRTTEIEQVSKKAIQYLHNSQYYHGGWYGSWGIRFTFATIFVIQWLKN
ncbi:10930_t:CDS:2, partial [Cetraspora pellucida]